MKKEPASEPSHPPVPSRSQKYDAPQAIVLARKPSAKLP
jgi:hypothetical protein